MEYNDILRKHNFEFSTNLKNIPHSYNAVRVSQYMANLLVNEARKNFQKFPKKKDGRGSLNLPVYACPLSCKV